MYHFIVNNTSGGGRSKRVWEELQNYLLEHETMDGDTFEAMMQEPKDTAPALPVQVPDAPADPE